MEPGLVYDISDAEYLDFLCALTMRLEDQCLPNRIYDVAALNYPSFAVQLPAGGGRWSWTVRGGGDNGEGGAGRDAVLADRREAELQCELHVGGTVGFGRLVWTSDMYVVSSPIAVIWRRETHHISYSKHKKNDCMNES
jgi:hypothetical protein